MGALKKNGVTQTDEIHTYAHTETNCDSFTKTTIQPQCVTGPLTSNQFLSTDRQALESRCNVTKAPGRPFADHLMKQSRSTHAYTVGKNRIIDQHDQHAYLPERHVFSAVRT